jgi:hypothetical protein
MGAAVEQAGETNNDRRKREAYDRKVDPALEKKAREMKRLRFV